MTRSRTMLAVFLVLAVFALLAGRPLFAQGEPVLEPQATNVSISEQTTPAESEWNDYRISLTPAGQIVVNNAFTLRKSTINSLAKNYPFAIDVTGGSFTMDGGIFQYPNKNNVTGFVHAHGGTSVTLTTTNVNGGVAEDFGGANVIQIDENASMTLGGHAFRLSFFNNAAIENNGTLTVSEGSEASFTRDIIVLKGTGTPLTIESGAELTMYGGTVTMQDNQGIVVKDGGKLVLENTTIKAAGTRMPITVEEGGTLEIRGTTSIQDDRQGSDFVHPGTRKLWELGGSEPPSGVSVAVRLYSGPSATDQRFTGATAWVDTNNGWTADFGEWPKYAEDGQTPVVYTVRELDDSGQEMAAGSTGLIGGTEYKASYGEYQPAAGDMTTMFDVTNARQTTTVALEATKTLVGRELAGGDFTFRLRDANDAVLQEKTNDAAGLVVFDPIGVFGTGVFAYTVEEVPGNEADMTYDTSKHAVNVTVTQAEDGSFTSQYAYTRDGKDVGTVAFENEVEVAKTYEPVTANITATKTLEGRLLEEGEFTFHLDDAHGESIQSKANDANGIVVFDELTFKEPGTYVYHVCEDEGNPAITYDSAYHVVTFHVHDAGDGKLVAQKTIELDGKRMDALAFDNVVSEEVPVFEPVTVSLGAAKTLEGRTLKDGEFDFRLDDAHGETIQTKANDAKGAVSFDALTVDKPGTYTWAIREVVGSDTDVTYDERVYDATAKVEEGPDGALVVDSVAYTLDGKEVEQAGFQNKYQGSDEEETPKKDSGSDTNTNKDTNTDPDTKKQTTAVTPTTKATTTTTTTTTAATPKTGDETLPPVALLIVALSLACVAWNTRG